MLLFEIANYALVFFAIGGFMDFGLRGHRSKLYDTIRLQLDRLENVRPFEVGVHAVRWISGVFTSKNDSVPVWIVLSILSVSAGIGWLLSATMLLGASLGPDQRWIKGVQEMSFDNPDQTYLVMYYLAGVFKWTCWTAAIFAVLDTCSGLFRRFDRWAGYRLRHHDRRVRTVGFVAQRIVIGLIYAAALSIFVSALLAVSYGLTVRLTRPAMASVLVNMAWDGCSIGATAGWLFLASKGGQLRISFFAIVDVLSASIFAILSYVSISLIYGVAGYRWNLHSDMAGVNFVLMTTAFVPTIGLALLLLGLSTLRFCQLTLQVVFTYAINLVAAPCDADSKLVLPFTTIGFFCSLVTAVALTVDFLV